MRDIMEKKTSKMGFVFTILLFLFSSLLFSVNIVYAKENTPSRKVGKMIWLDRNEIWFEILEEKDQKKNDFSHIKHPGIRSAICIYNITDKTFKIKFNENLKSNRRYFLEPTGQREIYFDNDSFQLVINENGERLFDQNYEDFRNTLQDFRGLRYVNCNLSRPDIVTFGFSNWYAYGGCFFHESESLIYSFRKKRYVFDEPSATDNYPVSDISNYSFCIFEGGENLLKLVYLTHLRPHILEFRVENENLPKKFRIRKIAHYDRKSLYFIAETVESNKGDNKHEYLCKSNDNGTILQIIDKNIEDYQYSRNLIAVKKPTKNGKGIELIVYNKFGRKLLSRTFINRENPKQYPLDFLICPYESGIAVFNVTNKENKWLDNIEIIDISGLKKISDEERKNS